MTRVQQVAPVRPTAGVMMDRGCTFTDVLLKALTFGQSQMAEAGVVRAAEPHTRIRLSVVVCARVRLLRYELLLVPCVLLQVKPSGWPQAHGPH